MPQASSKGICPTTPRALLNTGYLQKDIQQVYKSKVAFSAWCSLALRSLALNRVRVPVRCGVA